MRSFQHQKMSCKRYIGNYKMPPYTVDKMQPSTRWDVAYWTDTLVFGIEAMCKLIFNAHWSINGKKIIGTMKSIHTTSAMAIREQQAQGSWWSRWMKLEWISATKNKCISYSCKGEWSHLTFQRSCWFCHRLMPNWHAFSLKYQAKYKMSIFFYFQNIFRCIMCLLTSLDHVFKIQSELK